MSFTYPLPKWPKLLLSAGGLLAIIIFVLSLADQAGNGSLWILPVAAFLTIVHHVTYFVLSARKHGPPILPTPRLRQSVYRPSDSPRPSDVVAPVSFGAPPTPLTSQTDGENTPRQLSTPTPSNHSMSGPLIASTSPASYPPYLTNAATPTLACLLALLWTGSFWVPILMSFAENAGLRIAQGVLAVVEAGVLWAFFAVSVRQRKIMLKRRDFIRMDH